mmetsp:Transcript_41841/g.110297  ORF Transcript_41841/g.110297 Transcript_41841/m.110297 type:complete len:504 (-) Transcript_41841:291-1802(-)
MWRTPTTDQETLEALAALEVARKASSDRRSDQSTASLSGEDTKVYRYSARTSTEQSRLLAEQRALEHASQMASCPPPPPHAPTFVTPPPAAPCKLAASALAAALELDESDNAGAAMPKYVEAAELYMRAAAGVTGEQASKWSKRATECIERAEKIKTEKEQAEVERKEDLARREVELAERERRAALALAGAGSGILPAYWHATDPDAYSTTDGDGFVLNAIDAAEQPKVWAVLEQLLHTEKSSCLGIGRDVVHKGSYSSLKLACAWRVQHPALWARYEAGKAQVRRDCQRLDAIRKGLGLTAAGLPVLTENQGVRDLPGSLDADVREQMLLHGTKPDTLLAILANGPNERFSGGLFGNGTYFGEDAAKIDQYTAIDAAFKRGGAWAAPLHSRLYGHGQPRHPGKVFYCLVCRVALGHFARTKEGAPFARSCDGNGPVFASATNTRELAAVGGVTPPIHFHSLVAETGQKISRFREFIVFHSEYVYPEFLLSFHRVDDSGQIVG